MQLIPDQLKLESKRADQIKVGEWVVFMPVLGVATQVKNIKSFFDNEAKLDRVVLETADAIDNDSGWEPWRMFTVIKKVNPE